MKTRTKKELILLNLVLDKMGRGDATAECEPGKKLTRTTRELTTPLFLLRCSEIGIPPRDEELFTIGLIIDLMTEKGNDGKKYPILAGQAQFDAF